MIGFSGGIFGGVAGLSGPLPTIWCGLRGWNADTQRGVYQPCNLTIPDVLLCMFALQDILIIAIGKLEIICILATVIGAYFGIRMYGRINARQFRYLGLGLLFLLTISNIS